MVIEAVFVTRRITTERTRYMHILQKLRPDTVASVRDIICQVDTLAASYTRLKEKLTKTYGKSKYQLCNELFDMPPLRCLEAQHLDVQDVGARARRGHHRYVVFGALLAQVT